MVNAISCIDKFVDKLHKLMQDGTGMSIINAKRLCINIDEQFKVLMDEPSFFNNDENFHEFPMLLSQGSF